MSSLYYIEIYYGINQLTSLFYINNNNSLRGFLSIDIDVSGLYINQCDISNQFYSDSHHNSNFRYNSKFNHNQHQSNAQLFTHPIVSLQTPSPFHQDNEIDAFHDSHKCHRDSMDVRIVIVVIYAILNWLNCGGKCISVHFCEEIELIKLVCQDCAFKH